MKETTHTVNQETKTVTIHRRLSPLIHHAKFMSRLEDKYAGYTFVLEYL